MDLHLHDKVALITGGAKGIGEAITRAFAAEGAIPIILGRNPAEASALVTEITALGQRADAFHVEMTDEEQVRSAVAEIARKRGRIDIIVNNAGANDGIGLRHTPQEFVASLERNLIHYFVLVHCALDHLIASKGSIVNISSKTAVTGQGGTSGYVAAKAAINGLTREWALDLSKHGIRVNCVVPAEVITPLYQRWIDSRPDPAAALHKVNLTVPLGRRTTTPGEIADTVVFVASPRSSHTTGQILFVDGGYVHFDRAFTADTDGPATVVP
jgi:L-fucose dehydrogenase